ncbi:hypothetical protein E4U43_004977 [Claviceps pusilla]|uniref:CHRD domain-containing protein n=1 Tax=Claviceps pusilla TaxID=123648 RepID=A0A9P7NES1_9HYPO|nr:hypothetical protein E4U43_004977 [Claviceps pusilla]
MKPSVCLFAYVATVICRPVVDLEDLFTKLNMNSPFTFTSTYSIRVEPRAVVDNNNTLTGGLEGVSGMFNFGINSLENVICYNLTLDGFRGEFKSPANTATHIHQAAVNRAGPPRCVAAARHDSSCNKRNRSTQVLLTRTQKRIAFPNPEGEENGRRTSVGCLRGPFVTGVKTSDGSEKDTGEGFDVRQIEEDPSQFFTDVHSSLAPAGAVRGQLDSGNNC